MAIRSILEVPDPRLREISKPVERFDKELRTLVADLCERCLAGDFAGHRYQRLHE